MTERVREGEEEDEAAEKGKNNARHPHDFEGVEGVPVELNDVWVGGTVLTTSKAMVKSMKLSMRTRKRKNQK